MDKLVWFLDSYGLGDLVDLNTYRISRIYIDGTHKFFPNIGQPLQNPPIHPLHKDDPSYKNVRFEIVSPRLNYLKAYIEMDENDYITLRFTRITSEKFPNQYIYITEIEKSPKHKIEIKPIYIYSNDKREVNTKVAVLDTYSLVAEIVYTQNLYDNKLKKLLEKLRKPKNLHSFVNIKEIEVRKKQKIEDTISLVPILTNLSARISNGTFKYYFIPVNKVWIPFIERLLGKEEELFGSLVFQWDTASSIIILAKYIPTLAKEIFRSLISFMDDEGFLSQGVVDDIIPWKRINPLIVFIAYKKIFEYTKDISFLEEYFEKLEKYYFWVYRNRSKRGYGEGVMAWGGESKIDAMYESGLDDYPIWDFVDYDEKEKLLDCACLDLSLYFFWATKVLREASEILGKYEKVDFYIRKEKEIAKNIYETFLDDGKFFFVVGKKHIKIFTPFQFMVFDVFDTVGDKEGKEGLRRYFWEYVKSRERIFPSIGEECPFFDGDGDYWRGRIWPPLNYLVFFSLRSSGLEEEAELVARKSFELVKREWDVHRHIHENYSYETGRGEPKEGVYARSCPMYSWGGLMGFMSVDNGVGYK